MSPEKGKLRPTPPRAYLNPEFMASPQARGIRVLTEMTEPHQRFKKFGVRNTVVLFGSARTPPADGPRNRREADQVSAATPVRLDATSPNHRGVPAQPPERRA